VLADLSNGAEADAKRILHRTFTACLKRQLFTGRPASREATRFFFALPWIRVDKLSHGFGKRENEGARDCSTTTSEKVRLAE
jgi:hypothetical protein